jgi:hypothetical protein
MVFHPRLSASPDERPWMKHFFLVMRSVSFMRLVLIGLVALLAGSSIADAQIASVHFTIDPTRDVKPISRYIYGVNQFHLFLDGMNGPWSNLAFTRLGGNRFTAYNWTNNASQAGTIITFKMTTTS